MSRNVTGFRGRRRRGALQRRVLALLLPFVMLYAGHGAMRHEIGHLACFMPRFDHSSPVADEACPLCVAFAHLSTSPWLEFSTPAWRTSLTFARGPAPIVTQASVATEAPRSRGPPHA